jgi:exonuclease III
LRIATYNVNGVNGRLPVLLRWLEETAPDLVCLKELKVPTRSSRSPPSRRATTTSSRPYFRNAYARDAGLRIDHLLLSPSIADRLEDAQSTASRGWDKTSDHAPTWVEISD